jgi:hypothetical protein
MVHRAVVDTSVLPGIEPPFCCRLGCSMVTAFTELCRLFIRAECTTVKYTGYFVLRTTNTKLNRNICSVAEIRCEDGQTRQTGLC